MSTPNTNIEKIREQINIWIKYGEDEHPIPLSCGIRGVPLHPEFVYRKNGKWKGWNDLLGINEQSNDERDSFEDMAWSVYKYENP
jgi:hypothetical protein